MTPRRCQMIEDLTVRGLAAHTHKAFLHAVSQLAQHDNRRPDQLPTREVQRFLVPLHEERGLAWSSCNLDAQALRFFYRLTLGRAAVDSSSKSTPTAAIELSRSPPTVLVYG